MKKWIKKLIGTVGVITMVVTNSFSVSAAGVRDVFSAKYYADTYADLKAAFGYDEESLFRHYMTYGIAEGRSGSPVFDVLKYRETYGDLNVVFGENWDAYVEHYFTYGIEEGRISGGVFDPIAYADAYPDLKEAFGDDIRALTEHYLNYGIAEGRIATHIQTPAEGSITDNATKPTEIPTPTSTPKPTQAPAPTSAPQPTEAPAPTSAPQPTETPDPTSAPQPTETPTPTVLPPWEAPVEIPESTIRDSLRLEFTEKNAVCGESVKFPEIQSDVEGVVDVTWIRYSLEDPEYADVDSKGNRLQQGYLILANEQEAGDVIIYVGVGYYPDGRYTANGEEGRWVDLKTMQCTIHVNTVASGNENENDD